MTDTIADKLEIIDLMSRYCYAVDFGDLPSLKEVFTDDVEALYVLEPLGLGLDDVPLSGVDAVIAWLDSVLPGLGQHAPRHAMTNHLVELDGDVARSRSYLAAGNGLYTVGHVRTPHGWRAKTWEMRNFPPRS